MSAIKNPGLKTFLPIFLLLMFFSCNNKKNEGITQRNPNEITFISLSYIGGAAGKYKIIKITKDSIHAEKGITATKTHKEWKSANNAIIWEQLVSIIEVTTLDKIKSSPSAQSVDKVDETFQIRTPKRSHFYVNSYIDTLHYKQLQELKNQIKKILPKEYQ